VLICTKVKPKSDQEHLGLTANQLCRQHGGVLHTSVLSDVSFNPVLPSNGGFILSVSYGPILFHFYSILDEVSSRGLVWKLHIAL
jgi:hypothetical protein